MMCVHVCTFVGQANANRSPSPPPSSHPHNRVSLRKQRRPLRLQGSQKKQCSCMSTSRTGTGLSVWLSCTALTAWLTSSLDRCALYPIPHVLVPELWFHLLLCYRQGRPLSRRTTKRLRAIFSELIEQTWPPSSTRQAFVPSSSPSLSPSLSYPLPV